MVPSASFSKAAAAAGLPARYTYWSGYSGQRYLFTQTDAGSVVDFEEGVVIAVSDEQIIWAGEIAAVASTWSEPVSGMSLHVHLLATRTEDRLRIIGDLRPAETYLRLAA